jgi:hypothetical protein
MKLLPLRVAGLIVGWKSSERKRRGDEQQEGLNDGKYYPGRAKLATMPLLTGSVMWVNTMGIRPDLQGSPPRA